MSSGAQAMYLFVIESLYSREILGARMGGAGRPRLFFSGNKIVWISCPLGIFRCGLLSWKVDNR